MNVTATISTKGRSETTLPLAIEALVHQTVPPKQLVIWDDNENMKDLRGVSPYSHLFPMLMSKGIQWFHLPGGRKGQVFNHQSSLDRADTDLIWRLDDDNCAEPTCLENLLKVMEDPAVGAVGGLVLDPNAQGPRPSFITGKIEEIYSPFNIQWKRWLGPIEEVDHLYSTFLYRVEAGKKAGGYCRELSPVGHREETMFSHSIKRAGYKLLVTPHALTWHLREGTGGIRSFKDPSLWDHDEKIFVRKLQEWGVTPREYKFVVLDNGLGDHIVFKAVLPQILKKNEGKRIVLAVCYPEVFKDIPGVTLASIADAHAAFGNLDTEQFSVYQWCGARNWKRPLEEAFLEMHR